MLFKGILFCNKIKFEKSYKLHYRISENNIFAIDFGVVAQLVRAQDS